MAEERIEVQRTIEADGSAIFAILIAGPSGAIAGAVAAFKMLQRTPSVEKRQRLAVVTAAGIVGLVLIGWLASMIGGAASSPHSQTAIASPLLSTVRRRSGRRGCNGRPPGRVSASPSRAARIA